MDPVATEGRSKVAKEDAEATSGGRSRAAKEDPEATSGGRSKAGKEEPQASSGGRSRAAKEDPLANSAGAPKDPLAASGGGLPSPKGGKRGPIVLDEAVAKADGISTGVVVLGKERDEIVQQAELHQKAAEKAKARVKVAEAEQARLRALKDVEVKSHQISKMKLEEKDSQIARMRNQFESVKDDLTTARLENEALNIEMGARRKAFEVKLNFATRLAELKGKNDDTEEECDTLRKDIVRAKRQLESGKCGEEQVETLQLKLEMQMLLKEKGKRKVLEAFTRSATKGAEGLAQQFLLTWSDLVRKTKQQEKTREQNMNRTVRMLAADSSAMTREVMDLWHKELENIRFEKLLKDNKELMATRNLSSSMGENTQNRTLSMLQRQLNNRSKQIWQEFFNEWKGVKAERIRKEKAKAIATASIANSDVGALDLAFTGWMRAVKDLALENKRKEKTMAKGMRMIANNDKAMTTTIFSLWHKEYAENKKLKETKGKNNTKALRMISDGEKTLTAGVVFAWYDTVRTTKQKAKKMKAIEQSLATTDSGRLAIVVSNWAGYTKIAIQRKKVKDGNMTMAMRKVAGSNGALQQHVINAWKQVIMAQQLQLLREHQDRVAKIQEGVSKVQGQIDETTPEVQELADSIASLKTERDEAIANAAIFEKRAAELEAIVEDRQKDLDEVAEELEASKARAATITKELAKVGITLNATPKKLIRPPSADTDDGKLPQIPGASRPSGDPPSRPMVSTRNTAR